MRTWGVAVVCLLGCAARIPAQGGPALVPDTARVSGARGGEARAFTIRSSILAEVRRVSVVLPASHAASPATRRFPVIVVLDGETNLPATSAVADELARQGMIPEAILVAVENLGGARGRVRDLTPPGLSVSGSGLNEGGDRFLDFLERELLPAVDRQWRGGAPRTLVGHSSGGILVTYAAATRATYRAVISIDAPVGIADNWLARKLITRAKAPLTPLRYVSLEARFGWGDAEWGALAAAAPSTWQVRRERLRLEGHETMNMLAAYLGLREVFSDYSRLVAQEKPASDVVAHYATVSEALGGPLAPPRRLLRDVVDDLISEGRGAKARAAYRVLVQSYGAPADSADILADLLVAERQPEPTETVKSLLATPFPTADEALPFIGEWRGSFWMTPSEPRDDRVVLSVRVDSGRVIADIRNPSAPPDLRVRRVDYLRVTPAGLTFGVLNGMRPRGVVLWEGRLTGDTLSGKQRWGGVASPHANDPGVDPGFSFVRVRR